MTNQDLHDLYSVDISYNGPQVDTRRLIDLQCSHNHSDRKERPAVAYCSTVLSWTVLKYWTEVLNWSVLKQTEVLKWLWWEQVPFKYCPSRSIEQLFIWVIMYCGIPAPNESLMTVFKTLVSLSPIFSRTNILLAKPNGFNHDWCIKETTLMIGCLYISSSFALLQPIPSILARVNFNGTGHRPFPSGHWLLVQTHYITHVKVVWRNVPPWKFVQVIRIVSRPTLS